MRFRRFRGDRGGECTGRVCTGRARRVSGSRWRVALLVAAALFAATAGCKTATGPSSAGLDIDPRERASRVPLGDDTVALLKIHPEPLDRALEQLQGWRPESSESESATNLDVSDPGTRFAAALLDGFPPLPAALESPGRSLSFDALDATRPYYLAFSERGNVRQLRRIRYGYPFAGPDALRRGVVARLLLPSDHPERLADAVRSHCGAETDDRWMAGACGATVGVRPLGSFVEVELRYGAGAEDGGAIEPESFERGGLPERWTPAAEAFFGRTAAIAAYAESADFWKLGALIRRSELLEILDGASEELRGARFATLVEGLYRQAATAASGATETEDVAVLQTARDGVAVDVVRTYTDRGARVAEAGALEAKLPSVDVEEPQIAFEWAVDAAGALDRAGVPPVLEQFFARNKHRRSGLLERLQRMELGPGGLVGLALEAPGGVAAAAAQSAPKVQYDGANALRRAVGLRAVRALFRVRPDRESTFGIVPVGGLALELSARSNLDAVVEGAIGLARAAGLSVQRERERSGGTVRLRVAVGRSMEIFGDETAVSGVPTGRIDLDAIRVRIDRSGVAEHLLPNGVREADDWKTLELQSDANRAANGIRVRAGRGGGAPFAVPAASVEPEAVAEPPDCLRRAARTSREVAAATVSGVGETSIPDLFAYRRYVPRLGALEGDCTEAELPSDLIDALGRHWYRYGRALEASGFWSEGLRRLERACRRGVEPSCSARDRLAERVDDLELLDVGRAVPLEGNLRAGALIATAEGLTAGRREVLSSAELAAAGGGLDDAAVSEIAGQTGSDSIRINRDPLRVVPVAVDRALSAGALGRVTRLAGRVAEEAAYADGTVPSGAVVWVEQRPPERVVGEPTLEGLPFRHLASVDANQRQRAIRAVVSRRGWTIHDADGPVEPVDGCPDDGPTVCLRDDRGTVDGAVERYAELDGRDRAREAGAEIAGAYPYHRFHRAIRRAWSRRQEDPQRNRLSFKPRRLLLEVDRELPVEVVAKTAAAAARQGGGAESTEEMFGDLSRRKRLFDHFLLKPVSDP